MNIQEYFWRHFAARAIAFIALPLFIYLSVFWVHLSLLTNSGTGDTFMSPAFQETLRGNELLLNSQGSFILTPNRPASAYADIVPRAPLL